MPRKSPSKVDPDPMQAPDATEHLIRIFPAEDLGCIRQRRPLPTLRPLGHGRPCLRPGDDANSPAPNCHWRQSTPTFQLCYRGLFRWNENVCREVAPARVLSRFQPANRYPGSVSLLWLRLTPASHSISQESVFLDSRRLQ